MANKSQNNSQFKTVKTKSRHVQCSGDESSSHPLVYLDIAPEKDCVTCPYCSTVFVIKR